MNKTIHKLNLNIYQNLIYKNNKEINRLLIILNLNYQIKKSIIHQIKKNKNNSNNYN